MVGISIAGIYQFLPKLKTKILGLGNLLFIVGTIILLVAYFLCQIRLGFKANIYGYTTIAIGYGFWVLAAISPKSFLFKTNSFVTTTIATLSYSVYLIHKAIRHLFKDIIGEHISIDSDGLLMFLICLVASFLGALVLKYLVENPSQKLRNHLLKKTTPDSSL